jgi:preprotein translocase subunit SecF
MNIIKNRFVFLGIAGALVLASIVAVALFGLKPGIDLRGGTQWQFSIGRDANEQEVASVMHNVAKEEVIVKRAEDGSFIARLKDISQDEKHVYEQALNDSFGVLVEKNFSTIGPAIGEELRQKSIMAIIFVLLGISLYIAFAFRKVSKPVSSWKYGVVTLGTLFHDVAIPTGMLAVLGHFYGIEIDTNFIVALLVVMGFSVHDTIVVFDRIRENLLVLRGKGINLGDIINKSIHETFVRSINTTLTLVIVLVALLLVGPASLFYFVLTILVGTVFGTYSSIFVASPLLYLWEGSGKGRG